MKRISDITDEDVFFGHLKTALRAFVDARQMADEAATGTPVDAAWDAVSDLEDQTRKLLQAFGYTEESIASFTNRLASICGEGQK